MRLYRLLARHGAMRRRGYPWFAPPPVGAPMRYYGWAWDPEKREWIETDVAEVTIEIEVPKYPKPPEPPRPYQSLEVPGWEWDAKRKRWDVGVMPPKIEWVTPRWPKKPTEVPSGTQPAEVEGWRYDFTYKIWETTTIQRVPIEVEQERPPKPEYSPGPQILEEAPGWSWSETPYEWVATIIVAKPVEFEPPRSMPPFPLTPEVETAYAGYPSWVTLQQMLESMGQSKEEIQRYVEAVESTVASMHPLEGAKIDRAVAKRIVDLWVRTRNVTATQTKWLYGKNVEAMVEEFGTKTSPAFVIAVAVLAAAAIGVLIGSIMERIAFVDDDAYVLTEKDNTYLLGPENWRYSRCIGKSLKGRTFYSKCQGIRTEYTRHKRAEFKGMLDIIDFPGGFLEKGYRFPYFVKYTWNYWSVMYVGMLVSMGKNIYMLKAADHDSYTGLQPGQSIPEDEWCKDFHWYL